MKIEEKSIETLINQCGPYFKCLYKCEVTPEYRLKCKLSDEVKTLWKALGPGDLGKIEDYERGDFKDDMFFYSPQHAICMLIALEGTKYK